MVQMYTSGIETDMISYSALVLASSCISKWEDVLHLLRTADYLGVELDSDSRIAGLQECEQRGMLNFEFSLLKHSIPCGFDDKLQAHVGRGAINAALIRLVA